jgi:hypothetical protein
MDQSVKDSFLKRCGRKIRFSVEKEHRLQKTTDRIHTSTERRNLHHAPGTLIVDNVDIVEYILGDSQSIYRDDILSVHLLINTDSKPPPTTNQSNCPFKNFEMPKYDKMWMIRHDFEKSSRQSRGRSCRVK